MRKNREVAVEIVVADTGCGIDNAKLESIFREFEQIESSVPKPRETPGLGTNSFLRHSRRLLIISSIGLGLAIVARIVEQLGGQLRVDSRPGSGSRFSFLVPFQLAQDITLPTSTSSGLSVPGQVRARTTSSGSSELESIVEALSADHMNASPHSSTPSSTVHSPRPPRHPPSGGKFDVFGSRYPVRSIKLDGSELDIAITRSTPATEVDNRESYVPPSASISSQASKAFSGPLETKLRVLIVEDDPINRNVLAKRLTMDGHHVVCTTNGQECVELFEKDQEFDCVLMDIQ